MSRAWPMAVTKLTALLACCGLATSRLGLVVHELVGHGGAAIAAGGKVTDVWLFYFAGGWIRFRAPGGDLAIALGGIVVETVIGAVLVAVGRGDRLGARIVRAIGCALVIHAAWYLAVGTFHGFGDGVIVHRALGTRAWMVAVPAGALACAAAFAGARVVLGPLASTIPGGKGARLGGAVLAIVIAGGLQAGAAAGEVVMRRDAAYAAIMRPERDRVIARELAAWDEAQRRAGAAPSDADRRAMETRIERAHRTFPFAYVLGACTLLAIGLGAARSRTSPPALITPRLLAITGVLAAGSILLVIALDAAFA